MAQGHRFAHGHNVVSMVAQVWDIGSSLKRREVISIGQSGEGILVLLSHLWHIREERLAIGDWFYGDNVMSSGRRVVNGLTAKACETSERARSMLLSPPPRLFRCGAGDIRNLVLCTHTVGSWQSLLQLAKACWVYTCFKFARFSWEHVLFS